MKKVFFSILIMLFAFGLTMEAQRPQRLGTPSRKEMTPEKRAEQMAKQLELTAEQTQQVQKLFEERDAKRKERIADSSISREERQEIMQKERKDFDEKLEKIIGKEKMEKYDALRKKQIQSRQSPPRESIR